MSFAGTVHKQRTAPPVNSGSTRNRKPKARRKPSWDDTVNDLTVFKATADEIDRRKAVHRSQNVDVIKEEQLKKKISQARQRSHQDALSARSSGPAALLREILLDNSQLEETLAKSDTLLSAVKTILSEDQKRIQGLPNVTQAPTNIKSAKTGNGLFAVPTSRLDNLSDSIMDKKALNEEADFSWSTSDSGEREENSEVCYQPVMDLSRFQLLIQELDKDNGTFKKDKSMFESARNIPGGTQRTLRKTSSKAVESDRRTKEAETGNAHHVGDETPSATPRKDPAINDTARVTRTRAMTDRGSTRADDIPAMEDFNKVLEGLNNNLGNYEKQMGRSVEPSFPPPTSYTGYTRALLDAVAKMSCYFRENGEQLRTESVIRERLLQEVERLSGLVDALTADVIAIQEAYARLQNEFVKHRRETEQQFMAFLKALAIHGINISGVQRLNVSNTSGHSSGDPGHSRESHDFHNNDKRPNSLDAVTGLRPDPSTLHQQQQQQQQSLLLPATLLHPPLQMDSPSVTSGRQVRNAARSLDEVRGILQFEGDPQRPSSSLQREQDGSLLGHHSSDSTSAQFVIPSSLPDPVQRTVQLPFGAFHRNSESQRTPQELRHPERLQINSSIGQPSAIQVFSGRAVEQQNIHEQTAVEFQLAEVKRQQVEAERKLKELIERQQQEAKSGMFTRQLVSPSISPITVESESRKVSTLQLASAVSSKETPPTTEGTSAVLQNTGPPMRQIKVTLPQAPPDDEVIDSSSESVQGNTVKRVPSNCPSAQMISKPLRTKAQDTKNGGFFALTSHISS